MQQLLLSSALIWILGRVLKKKADMPPPVDKMPQAVDELPENRGGMPGPGQGPGQGPASTQGNKNKYRGGYL
jgi:hypothetical protein